MAQQQPGAAASWLSYVQVDDVDVTVEKAQSAGGDSTARALHAKKLADRSATWSPRKVQMAFLSELKNDTTYEDGSP